MMRCAYGTVCDSSLCAIFMMSCDDGARRSATVCQVGVLSIVQDIADLVVSIGYHCVRLLIEGYAE